MGRERGEHSLMFLVHPTITPEQMAGYAEAVRSGVVPAGCACGLEGKHRRLSVQVYYVLSGEGSAWEGFGSPASRARSR